MTSNKCRLGLANRPDSLDPTRPARLFGQYGKKHRRYLASVLSEVGTAISSSELCLAVADGPILFCSIENDHEHVLRAYAGAFSEQLHDSPEQRFLLFRTAGVEHGDLDVHDIGAPGDAVGITIAEVRSVMLRDSHELVVFGHVQHLAHRAVKAVKDRLPIGFRLSCVERNVKDRHRGAFRSTTRTILDIIVNLDDRVKNESMERAEWWAHVSLTSKR
jgi:hypothetical protein